MHDDIDDLIRRIETLRLEDVGSGPMAELSVRRLHLASALSEVTAHLLAHPDWAPSPEQLQEIGLLLFAMEESRTSQSGEASRAVAAAEAFVVNVRRAFPA